MGNLNVPCQQVGCGTPVADYIEPCEEYPRGAIRIIGKHHGRRDESILDLSKPPPFHSATDEPPPLAPPTVLD